MLRNFEWNQLQVKKDILILYVLKAVLLGATSESYFNFLNWLFFSYLQITIIITY